MNVSKKSTFVVQILETKLQLHPLEETCYLNAISSIPQQLEASQAPLLVWLLAQAAIFLKAGKSAVIVIPSHSDV